MSRSENAPTPADESLPDDETDPSFEKEAERAETEAALEWDLEGTFPTSDPPSSWAGPDVESEHGE